MKPGLSDKERRPGGEIRALLKWQTAAGQCCWAEIYGPSGNSPLIDRFQLNVDLRGQCGMISSASGGVFSLTEKKKIVHTHVFDGKTRDQKNARQSVRQNKGMKLRIACLA